MAGTLDHALLPGLVVSRETLDRLESYCDLIRKWSPRINLVSKASLPDLWTRHVVDCSQLWLHAPHNPRRWLDLGSGGGLPGLVIAIIAKELSPMCSITLVESDSRKSVFLQTVTRELDLNCVIRSIRIESLEEPPQCVVSARALAPLPKLLTLTERFLAAGALGLFPKGAKADSELTEARRTWHIEASLHPSLTDSTAGILRITEATRVS